MDVNASIRLSIIRIFVTLLLFGAALSLAGSAESGIPVIVSPYGIVMKTEVVFEGDSLTAEEVYPNYVAGALNLASGNNRSNHYDNVARSGEAVSPNMLNDGPAQVDSKYSASKYKNIAVLWGGTNDIFQDDALTVYNNICAWHAARKAAGFKTVAVTILPRGSTNTPAEFEKERQTVNSMLHANNPADALADVGNDSTIGQTGQEANETYYRDRVHLTAAGYAIIADYVKAAILEAYVKPSREEALVKSWWQFWK